jgi:hypothetical protein
VRTDDVTRVFDRFNASSNAKVKRLKRAGKEVRWAWFHGVLPIAATAPMRGSLCIGAAAADEYDIAAMADVTVAEARKALEAARALGMLDLDEQGVEWVHDFDVYNPEPKTDTKAAAAERARRYRERQRHAQQRDDHAVTHHAPSHTVTRDASRSSRSVTLPEVEVEGKDNSPGTTSVRDGVTASGNGATTTSTDEELAEHIRGMLANAVDGLMTTEGCKAPTRQAVLVALRRHHPSPAVALDVATEVRSIVQSQDRAPNIVGLYEQKLAQAVAA